MTHNVARASGSAFTIHFDRSTEHKGSSWTSWFPSGPGAKAQELIMSLFNKREITDAAAASLQSANQELRELDIALQTLAGVTQTPRHKKQIIAAVKRVTTLLEKHMGKDLPTEEVGPNETYRRSPTETSRVETELKKLCQFTETPGSIANLTDAQITDLRRSFDSLHFKLKRYLTMIDSSVSTDTSFTKEEVTTHRQQITHHLAGRQIVGGVLTLQDDSILGAFRKIRHIQEGSWAPVLANLANTVGNVAETQIGARLAALTASLGFDAREYIADNAPLEPLDAIDTPVRERTSYRQNPTLDTLHRNIQQLGAVEGIEEDNLPQEVDEMLALLTSLLGSNLYASDDDDEIYARSTNATRSLEGKLDNMTRFQSADGETNSFTPEQLSDFRRNLDGLHLALTNYKINQQEHRAALMAILAANSALRTTLQTRLQAQEHGRPTDKVVDHSQSFSQTFSGIFSRFLARLNGNIVPAAIKTGFKTLEAGLLLLREKVSRDLRQLRSRIGNEEEAAEPRGAAQLVASQERILTSIVSSLDILREAKDNAALNTASARTAIESIREQMGKHPIWVNSFFSINPAGTVDRNVGVAAIEALEQEQAQLDKHHRNQLSLDELALTLDSDIQRQGHRLAETSAHMGTFKVIEYFIGKDPSTTHPTEFSTLATRISGATPVERTNEFKSRLNGYIDARSDCSWLSRTLLKYVIVPVASFICSWATKKFVEGTHSYLSKMIAQRTQTIQVDNKPISRLETTANHFTNAKQKWAGHSNGPEKERVIREEIVGTKDVQEARYQKLTNTMIEKFFVRISPSAGVDALGAAMNRSIERCPYFILRIAAYALSTPVHLVLKGVKYLFAKPIEWIINGILHSVTKSIAKNTQIVKTTMDTLESSLCSEEDNTKVLDEVLLEVLRQLWTLLNEPSNEDVAEKGASNATTSLQLQQCLAAFYEALEISRASAKDARAHGGPARNVAESLKQALGDSLAPHILKGVSDLLTESYELLMQETMLKKLLLLTLESTNDAMVSPTSQLTPAEQARARVKRQETINMYLNQILWKAVSNATVMFEKAENPDTIYVEHARKFKREVEDKVRNWRAEIGRLDFSDRERNLANRDALDKIHRELTEVFGDLSTQISHFCTKHPGDSTAIYISEQLNPVREVLSRFRFHFLRLYNHQLFNDLGSDGLANISQAQQSLEALQGHMTLYIETMLGDSPEAIRDFDHTETNKEANSAEKRALDAIEALDRADSHIPKTASRALRTFISLAPVRRKLISNLRQIQQFAQLEYALRTQLDQDDNPPVIAVRAIEPLKEGLKEYLSTRDCEALVSALENYCATGGNTTANRDAIYRTLEEIREGLSEVARAQATKYQSRFRKEVNTISGVLREFHIAPAMADADSEPVGNLPPATGDGGAAGEVGEEGSAGDADATTEGEGSQSAGEASDGEESDLESLAPYDAVDVIASAQQALTNLERPLHALIGVDSMQVNAFSPFSPIVNGAKLFAHRQLDTAVKDAIGFLKHGKGVMLTSMINDQVIKPFIGE